MNKSILRFSSKLVLGISLFGLAACGKSLHLSLKTPVTGALVNAADGSGLKTGVTPPAEVSTQKSLSEIGVSTLDGQITGLSQFDLSPASAFSLPFLNLKSSEGAFRNFGDPAFTYDENGTLVGYVKHSNVVFRAVHLVPEKKDIIDVLSFELHLKGVVRSLDPGAKADQLTSQILCMMDTKNCSGDISQFTDAEKKNLNPDFKAAVLSKDFSSVDASVPYLSNQDGTTINQAKSDVVIDLKSAFALKGLKTEALVDWIYANSKEFADPHYRKFRFVIANNTYFQSGTLVLQFRTTSSAAEVEVPTKLINGESDVIDSSKKDSNGINKDILPVFVPINPTPTATPTPAPVSVEASKVEVPATAPTTNAATTVAPNSVAPTAVMSAPVAAPNTLETAPVVSTNLSGGVDIKMPESALRFKSGSAAVLKKDAARLKRIGQALSQFSKEIKLVTVRAQTDQVGKKAYNQKLSDRRATSVAAILLKSGMAKTQLKKIGLGEVKVSTCAPHEDCAADRNVTLSVDLNPKLTSSEQENIRDNLIPILQHECKL